MKSNFALLIMIAAVLSAIKISSAQNTFPSSGAAGIRTTSLNASSLLDVVSTSKGILIPRMTKTQRENIEAGVLASGTYSYTLYVDGKMINTKQMELLK